MAEFILAAFLYAKLKMKYNLIPIFKHWSIYPPMLFLLIYIGLEIMIWQEQYYFLSYSYLIKTATLLSYIPLIIKYKLYENEEGKLFPSPMIVATFCLALGSALNRIAMYFNSGYMMTFISNSYWTGYIKPEFIEDGLHKLGNAYSSAIPFCNQFDLGYSILSLGDILIRLFVFIILYHSIKNSNIIEK